MKTTSEVTNSATCEGKGETTYTAVFTNEAFEKQTKTVENIEALGHDYELTGWTWNGHESASAAFTCKNDSSHVQNVAAKISSEVTEEPSCEKDGTVMYTASAEFEGKTYTDQKTETVAATGHAYKFSKWEWNGDDTNGYTEAKALFVCENNMDHTLSVTAELAAETDEPPSEKAGKTF